MNEKAKFPRQIKYIVGNEACERFSFYGMRSILFVFMTTYLTMATHEAMSVFHLFVAACYLLPLFGGFLADRYLGKYHTIIYLSLVYCLGHGVLAVWGESQNGLFAGLALIALGAGGIKPCVSAHVGDQFTEKNAHLIEKVFNLFYWSINFGSFFASLLIPIVLTHYGPGWAFGIPGILMFLATYVFWLGRKNYVFVPPTRNTGAAGFLPVFLHALKKQGKREKGQGFFDAARDRFSAEEVDAAQAAAAVFKVFIAVTVFWALYDQHSSSWVHQAAALDRSFFGYSLEASQIQALNPILVMLLIPAFTWGVYPFFEKTLGIRLTSLRKIGAGMFVTGLSFVAVAAIQVFLDAGAKVSVAWQLIPFIILTAGEVMVSITGLEFAYTQAPRSMKSTIMSFWLLTIFGGNFLTAIVSSLNKFSGSMEYLFYALLMFIATGVFIWIARHYKVRNYVEAGDMGTTESSGGGAGPAIPSRMNLEASPG